jgi:hypothetical protein
MNLEELVRTALADEARAEPDETGAYDRFLHRRRRHAVAAAASTGLPAPPPVPVSAGGVVRRERQGFELTLPEGWNIDQVGTASYAQLGQSWLVISPGGRLVGMNERGVTIHTAVTPPSEYPGGPVKDHDDLGGQSFSTLSGHRSSDRRPDGRAYTVGDQGGLVTYMIACPTAASPPTSAPRPGGGGSCSWTSGRPAARRGSRCGGWPAGGCR